MTSDLQVYDGFGRYGGEEFLMVMPGCDLSSALRRAEEIRKKVCTFPIRTALAEVLVTLSLGIVAQTLPSDVDAEAVLRWADQALYSAKHKGRNRVERAIIGSCSEREAWATNASWHLAGQAS
jgi:two-component system cell cycle response regulator